MAKGYWMTVYRVTPDAATLAKYSAIAVPAITAHGGRILARGNPRGAYEGADSQRCVIIEFDSVEQAIAAYESKAYQGAVSVLEGLAEREVRIVEGA